MCARSSHAETGPNISRMHSSGRPPALSALAGTPGSSAGQPAAQRLVPPPPPPLSAVRPPAPQAAPARPVMGPPPSRPRCICCSSRTGPLYTCMRIIFAIMPACLHSHCLASLETWCPTVALCLLPAQSPTLSQQCQFTSSLCFSTSSSDSGMPFPKSCRLCEWLCILCLSLGLCLKSSGLCHDNN